MAGVTRYWATALSLTPFVDGASFTWNNAVQRGEPDPDTLRDQLSLAEYQAGRDGYQTNGAQNATFVMQGDGKSVDFVARGGGPQGVTMTLWCPGTPEERQIGSNGRPLPWVDVANDPAFISTTNQEKISQAAVRHLMVSGKTYYLEVGSAAYDSTAPTGTGYDQTITLTAGYTPDKNNDHRDTASDVIIFSDGATYHGVPKLNVGASQSNDGLDDPQQNNTFYTLWWKYQPTKSGNVEVYFEVLPSGFPAGSLRIYRINPDGTFFTVASTDTNATTLAINVTAGDELYMSVGANSLYNNGHGLGQYYRLQVTGSKSGTQLPAAATPDPAPYQPPKDTPWDDANGLPTDPFNPSYEAPASGDSGTATVLDLVRTFSSQVRRSVRITGPRTIEMVDPAVPLPAGMTTASSAELYHSATRGSAATAGVLSVRAGDVTVTGSAELITDDVRLVRSSWRIPDRLPFYGLPPAPVQRVTLTFTPHGFTASVDFHFPAVPLAARRS